MGIWLTCTTIKNLINTMKTLSIDCNEFYHQTFLLLYFSANINKNISLIYTKGIATKKKARKMR